MVAWPSAPSRRHESNFDSSSHAAKLSVAEPAAQFCERVVVAGDRIRGAGLKAGGQVRRFGDGGCLRSPMRQRLQSQHSKAAGCAMEEDFLSPGVLTRDPGPAAVSHIVTKL